MCNCKLIVTSSVAVLEAGKGVKSMCMIKLWLKTRKRENIEIFFYIKRHLKDGLGMEFTA